ncbi:MAG: hypothetical protein GAK41_00032 [Burkholderia gladioli]|nr:MAG: hypothetical protein GAK41_00032 [Burkholderia gladioli]
MNVIRALRAVAARRAIRRVAPCLAAGVFSVAVQAASPSPLPPSPTQSTDLLLGLFVNGDLSKGQQYNEAMRGVSGGAQQVDLETYATLRAQNPRLLAERIVEAMPEARREAIAEPLRRLLSAVSDAIGRSRCRTTGETRELDPANDEQWIAKVGYTCERLPIWRPSWSGCARRCRVSRSRPRRRPRPPPRTACRGWRTCCPLHRSNCRCRARSSCRAATLTGWRAPAVGDMIDVVSRSILEAIGIPVEMNGQ